MKKYNIHNDSFFEAKVILVYLLSLIVLSLAFLFN